MSNIIKCKNCGAEAVVGQAYCGECGTKIEHLEDTIGPFGKKTEPLKKEKKSFDVQKFFKKYWKYGAIIIAIAIVATVAISFLNNAGSDTIVPNENSSIIELYPTSEVSSSDMKTMSKQISERIEILEIDYKINATDEKITIQLDKEYGENDKIKSRIIDILKADGKLGMTSFGWPTIENCTDHIEDVSIESETKDKFKRYYRNDISETTMEKIMSGSSDQINYLRVKIDGTLSIDFKKEVEELKSDFYLSALFDAEKHLSVFGGSAQASYSDIGSVVNIDENYREFILVPYEAAASEKAVNLLKHVLTSKQLECVFEVKFLDNADWETDASLFGENQIAELESDYIEVEYKLSANALYYNDFEEGVKTLKKRLDAVGIPYCLGYKGLNQEIVVVKISPEKFNADMLRFISEYASVQLYSPFHEVGLQIKDIEIAKTDDGHLCLNVPLGSSYGETSIEELINDYLSRRNGYDAPAPDISEINPQTEGIYLVAGDVTIAGTNFADLQDDGVLTFTNLLCFGKETISDDEYWLLDMVKGYQTYDSALKGEDLPVEEIIISYYKDGAFVTKDVSEIPWKYDNSTVDPTIEKIVTKHGATVEKSYQARNTLIIKLDIDEDGNFADNFMDTIEKIYEECDFDSCSYKDVRFTDANAGETNPADAAEITFGKTTGRMTASYAFFDGPTYKKYQEDIKKISDTSEFYQSKMYQPN